MIKNTAEVVGALKSTDKIPYNTRVRLRCLEEEFKDSKSSGNLMIERTWEIVYPETIELADGRKVNPVGQEITQYRVTVNKNPDGSRDERKSDKSWDNFLSERRSLGLPVEEQMDDENPPLDLSGKIVEATISSQESPEYEPLTAEDRAAGKKVGKPIVVNGNPVVRYRPQVVALLEMSSMQVNAPY